MNISDLQLQLHQAIDSISDKEKLVAIYKFLKGSKGPYHTMTEEEYVAAIDEARRQIEEGQFQSVDELEKESENW